MQRRWIVVGLVVLGLSLGSGAPAFDFNGDGADNVTIFRPSNGLWAVRGITKVYFGTWNDEPAAGDYDGDGTDEIAIYRASSGLWANHNGGRIYFGGAGDLPLGTSDGDWYRSGDNLCALAAGNIGIGTGTPSNKLDITVGTGEPAMIKIEQPGTKNWAGLRLDRDGNEKWFIGMDSVDNGLLFRRGAASDDLFISLNGNVGIGTLNPGYKLDVNGDINTSGDVLKSGVAYNNPDYVFEPEYQFLSLTELREFIADNKHLPGMPSTKEVQKEGVKIFEQNRLMLEKLEEAYLYIFQQSEDISRLRKEIADIEKLVNKTKEVTGE